jgi:hypothetical protein
MSIFVMDEFAKNFTAKIPSKKLSENGSSNISSWNESCKGEQVGLPKWPGYNSPHGGGVFFMRALYNSYIIPLIRTGASHGQNSF